jgi:phosphoglycolate phosphatase
MVTREGEHRLVLWDIDHTLIDTRGVGRRLYHAAFEAVTGRPIEHEVDVTGRTELAIFAETAGVHGVEATDDLVRQYQIELTRQYEDHIDELRERGCALPGAQEVLRAAATATGLVQTVLTGNLRAVAITKLRAFGLDEHIDFSIGAFGDDDSDRAKLVAFAQRRSASKHNVRFDRTNTVVIGDSTSDVSAAREGGAAIIGIASGRDPIKRLQEAGAATVLPDLSNATKVLAVIEESLPSCE